MASNFEFKKANFIRQNKNLSILKISAKDLGFDVGTKQDPFVSFFE